MSLLNNITFNDQKIKEEWTKSTLSLEERWRFSRELFWVYCDKLKVTAWHIHDGWFTDSNGISGSHVLKENEVKLTWISSHGGFSHSSNPPKAGDTIIIKEHTPDIRDDAKPFILYFYTVVEMDKGQLVSDRFVLKLKHKEKCTYEKTNQSYIKR